MLSDESISTSLKLRRSVRRGRRQNQRIACVVLGTCHSKAVAKAINLLRIDGKYGKTMV